MWRIDYQNGDADREGNEMKIIVKTKDDEPIFTLHDKHDNLNKVTIENIVQDFLNKDCKIEVDET